MLPVRLRLITASVALPILAILVFWGGWLFSLGIAVVAAVAVIEICNMARSGGFYPLSIVSVFSVVLIVCIGYFLSQDPLYIFPVPVILATASLVYLTWVIASNNPVSWISNIGVTIACPCYVGCLMFYAPILRGIDQGTLWVLVTLTVTFAVDTGALYAGKKFGKNLMVPSISPSKTWEGAVAGFILSIVLTPMLVIFLDLIDSLYLALGLGFLIGIVGQLGDLAESKLKRVAGFKDSGVLMPGHGGVLDRLDSVVFNLALVYYFVIWTIQ